MAAHLDSPAWLVWLASLLEGVSRSTSRSATLPPDLFSCALDQLPLHLIPHGAGEYPLCSVHTLRISADCKICRSGVLPDEVESEPDLRSCFALQGAIAWVRDRSGDLPVPFWLEPDLESAIGGLQAGAAVPESVPESTRSLLERAGILVCDRCRLQRAAQREQMIQRAGALFRAKGYAPVGGLIHPFHIAALRRYYRYQIRTGAIQLGDGQSPRRYVAYNDPVARFFHRRIAATFSEVAGEPVKPSYVYLASYLSGADLKKHTDREQCEFSITFCLDFTPEPELATPWPISLDTAAGKVSVYQTLGDGLAYRGTRLPHYRSTLGAGQTSTSIFFHYVGSDFTGSLA